MPASPRALEGIHTVVTPEQVEFSFPLAGLYSRFLAWLIDAALILFGTGAVLQALSRALGSLPGVREAVGFVVFFLVDWGYGITLETLWSGQTVGKRVLGLRVIQESGVRIGLYPALLRNLARAIDRLPICYAVGALTALINGESQRLGDLLAGTVVVRERKLRAPASIAGAPAEVPADPLVVTRIRRLGREERELLLSSALRREELAMSARLTLFGALARRLEDVLELPKPVHLSDEKWVLGITAAATVAQK